MNIADNAKKSMAICFVTCALVISAQAQSTVLTLKGGSATVRKTIQPRSESAAHYYNIKLRKGQRYEIKVDSKGLFLSKENECGMVFELFDEKNEAVFIGDSMVGIDVWEGEVEKTGNYKIKVAMSCLEGSTTAELRKKKPTFNYSLRIQTKPRRVEQS
jgi:uncharacterized membrane protein